VPGVGGSGFGFEPSAAVDRLPGWLSAAAGLDTGPDGAVGRVANAGVLALNDDWPAPACPDGCGPRADTEEVAGTPDAPP
jgi:hypothetical protein